MPGKFGIFSTYHCRVDYVMAIDLGDGLFNKLCRSRLPGYEGADDTDRHKVGDTVDPYAGLHICACMQLGQLAQNRHSVCHVPTSNEIG